ncbi:hypothetical protein [Pseudomonas alkylphenolica]|uniref:DUF2513 domain-containing protein n=1 Tax=Pseudomonas alkylphenolica TaxID=237609 RepID=A0A077FBE6_9PSED|nr:hypothetical protein [Pseudomonas alkylphenolica]AIL61124.1 hypothetical protein PSAKL28_19000 [Pseudomonas alkylphenolica]
MRRDLKLVNHLLRLIQDHADYQGIYLINLTDMWEGSSDSSSGPLAYDQLVYLVNRCEEAGFLSVAAGNLIQLTWQGHDYLDAQDGK